MYKMSIQSAQVSLHSSYLYVHCKQNLCVYKYKNQLWSNKTSVWLNHKYYLNNERNIPIQKLKFCHLRVNRFIGPASYQTAMKETTRLAVIRIIVNECTDVTGSSKWTSSFPFLMVKFGTFQKTYTEINMWISYFSFRALWIGAGKVCTHILTVQILQHGSNTVPVLTHV